jgi:hypothetical protein
MNTRQLIAALHEADPSGEAPVVVDNAEVYVVEHIQAYWDGRAQLHIVDESKKPYWHIVGMRVTSKGSKVRLTTVSVEDFIDNFPDGEVVIDVGNERMRAEWEERVAQYRAGIKSVLAEIETERRLTSSPPSAAPAPSPSDPAEGGQ